MGIDDEKKAESATLRSRTFPQSLEKLESQEKVRVTIANIVQTVCNSETGEVRYVGILERGKQNSHNVRSWQAIGGALRLTKLGKRFVDVVGGEALMPQDSPEADDARFTLPTKKMIQLMPLFARLRPLLFEDTVEREFMEELTGKEFVAYPPVLTEDQAKRITYVSSGPLQELPLMNERSYKFLPSMPVTRLFYTSSVVVPNEIFKVMQDSPVLHFFSDEEVRSIFDANLKGEEAHTAEGEPVRPNLVLVSKSPSAPVMGEDRRLYAEETELEYTIYIELAEAIKGGRKNLEDVLRNLVLPSGDNAGLSDSKIQKIIATEVPKIRELVLDR